MRTAATNAALELSITPERLGKYLAASDGNLDRSLSLYERNARLSESFYTPLQAMEVCLRNALHRRLSNRYGMYWYLQGQAPLKEDSLRRVQDAIADLSQANKDATPGSVVAELGFGFWVGLLGPRYDQDLWRQALFRAFRENGAIPKRERVHRRLNALRRFRNRVAHHEPIFLNNLPNTHAEIIETLNWMCPDTAAWAHHHSRFPTVFDAP